MDIGQKLKEKRTALGLSQEDLAKAVGVSRQTVSSWENNRSYPDIGSTLKFSDLYGASLDDQGAFSQAQPFGYDYRIVEVEYGQAPETPPTLELSMVGFSLIIDNDIVGNFTYIEPREDQTAKGIWQLISEDASALYKLEVSAQDETTLAYFVDDQLQWRWEIAPVPVVQLMARQYGTVSIAPIDCSPREAFPGTLTI